MEPEEQITILSQVTITRGIDSDGDAVLQVSSDSGSITEALGMLEYAKIQFLKECDVLS